MDTEHNLHSSSGLRKVVWDSSDWRSVRSELENELSPESGSLMVSLDFLRFPAVMILKRISSWVFVSVFILSFGSFGISSVSNWKLADIVRVLWPTTFVRLKGFGLEMSLFES